MRVLISVYDKSGLDAFARGLDELGAELVASGGTAAYLEGLGLDVRRVEELTEVPELLGGRVKTLHPRVHAGILARRDRDDDLAALAEHEIPPFHLVCVNLYPFEREPGVELIDVGGPAMLRAAAKNWAHVGAVCRRDQYETVLAELRAEGELSDETRRALAADAFATTAAYDAAVARWLDGDDPFPEQLVVGLRKERELAYGENPHQRAAYYAESETHLLAGVRQLHGRELSFINVYDLAAARGLLAELGDEPACVIVKHANPCGVAVASTIEGAYERALAGDPLSAFGLVCALNRPVSATLARALADRFVDVLYAPEYEGGAVAALQVKPATRILAGPALAPDPIDYKRVPSGFLAQERDPLPDDAMDLVCGSVSDAELTDVRFAWTVCKHVTSNAIVIARDRQAIGIGAGQQSRVDAVRLAVEKARDRGHELEGAVLASDAFFPFPDGPLAAIEAGVRVIAQPGGARRDAEVASAVEAAGAAMLLTGRRHFRH